MGWLLCKKHPDVKEKGRNVDMSDLWADPLVRFQRRFYIPLVILLRGVIFMGVPMWYFGETLFHSLTANMFCYVITLHHTWLVNSAAHMFGSRPYDKTINPRENKSVVYLSMGEGYHNYHHAFPWDYSASEFGYKDNFNPATAFIDFMCYVGLAYDKRMPSRETVAKRIERTGDVNEWLERKRYQLNYWMDLLMGFFTIFWPMWIIYSIRWIKASNLL
jgi:stearoyl-CoA desaturase (delta-9 desaturase)